MRNAHISPCLQRKRIRTAHPTHEVVSAEEANLRNIEFALNAAAAVASSLGSKINHVFDLNTAPLRTIWGSKKVSAPSKSPIICFPKQRK
jgi:hypothetical protein